MPQYSDWYLTVAMDSTSGIDLLLSYDTHTHTHTHTHTFTSTASLYLTRPLCSSNPGYVTNIWIYRGCPQHSDV